MPLPDRETLRRWLEVPTAFEWLLLPTGLFLCLSLAWLLDDAFVYFRYADNALFLKLGLVYNQGEYVEGFSSPAWMLKVLTLRAMGLDYWLMVRLVGVASFTLFWVLAIAIHRRLVPPGATPINWPLAFLSVSYPVLCYFTSGMETPWVMLCAAVFVMVLLWPQSRVLQFSVALAPLIRPEHALLAVITIAALWLRERRPPWFLIVALIAIQGSWLMFRIVYYADFVPNTYHLKDRWALAQGFRYAWQVVTSYGLIPLAILYAMALYFARRRQVTGLFLRERGWWLLMGLGLSLYVVKVGGDFMHFRYLALPFCVFFLSAGGLLERFWRWNSRWSVNALLLVVTVVSFFLLPPQLGRHPLFHADDAGKNSRKTDYIFDAESHRRDEDLAFSPWTLTPVLDQRDRYEHWLDSMDEFEYETVNAGGWCVGAFRRYNERVVHRWGLTEPIIAHMKLPWNRPGHPKGGHENALVLRHLRLRHPGGPTGVGIFDWAAGQPYLSQYPWIAA